MPAHVRRMMRFALTTLLCSACIAAEPFEPGAMIEPREPPVDPGMTADPLMPTFWQDVEPLLRSQCHFCHGQTPLYGAPMALVSYRDAYRVHERIAERIQPNSGKPPMPPVANGHLTDEEIQLIAAWSKNGAPEGTPPIEDPMPDPDPMDMPDPDPMEMPDPDPMNPEEEPYLYFPVLAPMAAVRPGTEDLYGCFRTVIDTDVPLHVVELEPKIDQPEVVHHILLFRDGGRNYPEQKTGLLCAADTVVQGDWELLHGWAPGGEKM